MTARTFPLLLGRRSRPLLRLFGVHSAVDAYVAVDDRLDARFGRFSIHTPVTNIARWRIDGPWLWLRAIGVRIGWRRRDLTFAGTNRGGVRLDFVERVPFGPIRVTALYVAVADLEGFGAYLTELGIPRSDAPTMRAR